MTASAFRPASLAAPRPIPTGARLAPGAGLAFDASRDRDRRRVLPPHPFTRVAQMETGAFIATGRPLDGAYFTDAVEGMRDPLFLAEFARRGIETVARTALGMAPEDVFVLKSITLTPSVSGAAPSSSSAARCGTDARDACRTLGASDAAVIVPASGVRRRRSGAAYALDGPVRCLMNGATIALYDGTAAFLEPPGYAVLRRAGSETRIGLPEGRIRPCTPGQAGKSARAHVLIGRLRAENDAFCATVVPQARTPFFDRPLDHYPGLFLAEAARQLVHAARYSGRSPHHTPHHVQNGTPGSGRLARVGMTFLAFAELDEPPTLRATPLGPDAFEVEVRQGGRVRTRFEFIFASDGGGTPR